VAPLLLFHSALVRVDAAQSRLGRVLRTAPVSRQTKPKPDATNVAGLRTWNSLGRFVKRGEKGIMILAPMIGHKKADSVAEATEDAKQSQEQKETLQLRVDGGNAPPSYSLGSGHCPQTGSGEMPNRCTSGIVGGSHITFRQIFRVVTNLSVRLASFI